MAVSNPIDEIGDLQGYDFDPVKGEILIVGSKGRWGYEGFKKHAAAWGAENGVNAFPGWVSGAASQNSYDIAVQKQKSWQADRDLDAKNKQTVADRAATVSLANAKKIAGYQAPGRGGTILGGAAPSPSSAPKQKTILGY